MIPLVEEKKGVGRKFSFGEHRLPTTNNAFGDTMVLVLNHSAL